MHDAQEKSGFSRRLLLKRGAQGAVAATFVFSVGASQVLDVTRVRLPVKGLPAQLSGLRIVFASDVHLGTYVTRESVRAAVRTINGLGPDLTLLGGDLASEAEGSYRDSVEELSRIRSPLGVFSVPGNHEYWDGIERYREALAGSPIVDVTNRGVAVERGGARLWVAGLDDEWGGGPDPRAALGEAPPDVPRIVFMHNPTTADALALGCADLLLAGHTHGWQIYCPLVTRLLIPEVVGRKYRAGFYSTPAGPLYVSRGVGAIYPGFRLWCRPEIVLFDLTRA